MGTAWPINAARLTELGPGLPWPTCLPYDALRALAKLGLFAIGAVAILQLFAVRALAKLGLFAIGAVAILQLLRGPPPSDLSAI